MGGGEPDVLVQRQQPHPQTPEDQGDDQVPQVASEQHPHLEHQHQGCEKAHQGQRAGLNADIFRYFYICVVVSVLTSIFTVWYDSCTVAEKEALQGFG